jgi:hypothetical protein
LFEQCHGLREPAVRQTLSELTAEDGYSVMLGYLGITLAYLGYFDEARSKANEGLLEARRLQHAYTLTFCLLFMCEVASLANLPQEVRRHAEEMFDIANEHGFPHFVGYAMTNRGVVYCGGQASDAVILLEKGVSLTNATGAVINTTQKLTNLARSLCRAQAARNRLPER